MNVYVLIFTFTAEDDDGEDIVNELSAEKINAFQKVTILN